MKSGNSRIEELIERYQMGVTDEDEVAELEQALKENAGMREALIAAARLDTILHEEALNAAVDAESKRVDFPQPIISSKAVFAAAAAVVALALLIQFQDNRPTGPDSAQALVTPVAESKSESAPRDTVARLVAVVDAEWRDDGLQPGGALAIGGFVLNRGTADMEFNDGARISLRGPVVFELKAANHLHLISGNLVANIPDDGLGFLLTTPQSEVIDLGTEFGLAVDGAGRTDVHVIDGLVEVYGPRNSGDPLEMRSIQTGIKIPERQARRLEIDKNGDLRLEDIPFRSRQQILGNRRFDNLGLSLLRGSIRVKNMVSKSDLNIPASGQSRIEVIPEKTGVLLEKETVVTFRSPGNYRYFGAGGQMIPAGTKVDSYLLHFRSTEGEPIRGVIKFDRPIVGLICEANQLASTDAFGDLEGVDFLARPGGFRGLEPHAPDQVQNPPSTRGGGWTADEVTLSQDMTTLGLSVNVDPIQGVDQLRVLILSNSSVPSPVFIP
jgi:ferric-dicitrate binding protein FerR (iron transport regulator)